MGLLPAGHGLAGVFEQLVYAVVGMAVQDDTILRPVGAVAAQDVGFPDEKEEQGKGQPQPQEVTKAGAYNAGHGGDGEGQEQPNEDA